LSSRLLYDGKKSPRILNDNFRLVGLQGLGLHTFSADAEGGNSRFDKFSRVRKIDTPGGHHLNLRKRSLQRLDVFGAADLAAGEKS